MRIYTCSGKVWNGSLSDDWHTADNWAPSGAPTSGDDVLIPNVTRDPVISSADAAVANLTIEPGAVLDLSMRELTVEGALTNDGALGQTQDVELGVAANFMRITDQAGAQTQYYGVDITPSGTALPTLGLDQGRGKFPRDTLTNVTVSISGNQFCPGRASGVRRCFDITSAAAMSATVRFYFGEAERDGLSLGDLVAWRYNGESWVEQAGPHTRGGSGDAQYVEVQGVDDFSLYALDETTHPVYLPLLMNN